MANYDHNLAQFGEGFLTPGADLRFLVGYDSMTSESGTLQRCSTAHAILATWEFPNLADGSPALVSIGQGGQTTTSRLFGNQDTGGAGWTKNNTYVCGGTASDASVPVAPAIFSGPASGGETGVACNHAADWTIASGASRTAYSADGSSTGVLLQVYSGWSPITSATHAPLQWFGHPDAFSGRQCHARMLWTKNPASPADMLLKGIRQVPLTNSISSNNTKYASSATVDMSVGASIEYAYADADCGATEGEPGYILANPTSVGGATATRRIYHTGSRVFRSSSGNPLAGVSIASIAIGSIAGIHHASHMGVSGLLAGEPANRQGPDPWVSAANAAYYVRALAGCGSAGVSVAGRGYPNRIIIYTNHNWSGTEGTQLSSGQSALMNSWIVGLMQQHDSNAAACGSEAPRYLLVIAEKFYSGYTVTQRTNSRATIQQAAINFGPRASVIDMYDRTYDGTSEDTATWYCVGNSNRAASGSGSGPVIDPAIDQVHNSYPGAYFIWRMVWQSIIRAIGYDPGTFGAGQTRPLLGSGGLRNRN